MDSLEQLAILLRQYNAIGKEIASLIGRPAQIGHAGEFIAAQIFDIRLEHAANTKAIDGRFASGPLTGCSVNIKWYAMQENLLDVCLGVQPDYYLVMTGPPPSSLTSRGGQRPWLLQSVFLFASHQLLAELAQRGVKVSVATSVRKATWDAAMIYPHNNNPAYVLSELQRQQLALFTWSSSQI
jgi:hypothetical protein